MFRPQRLIRTPEGFRDEPYVYAYNDTFGTGTTGIVPLGNFGPNLIPLDQDADFYLCSIAFLPINLVPIEGSVNSNLWLGIQIQDTFGRVMSDNFCALWLYAICPFTGTGSQKSTSGYAPIFQDPVYNQAGGAIQFTIHNFSDTYAQPFAGPFEFRGFKRHRACRN